MDTLSEHSVSHLMQLGLTNTQARVYFSALRLGRGSAREIARDCSMDCSEIYRRIKELERMDLIQVELGKPNVYLPRNPERTVDRLLTKAQEELSSKNQAALQLKDEIDEVSRARSSPPTSKQSTSYRLAQNREQLARELVRFHRQTKEEILAVAPARNTSVTVHAFYIDLIKDSHDKGVSFRYVTEVNDANFADAKVMSQYGQVRHFPGIALRLFVYDRKMSAIGACPSFDSNPYSWDEPYVVVEDPAFGSIAALLFESIWNDSTEVDFAREPSKLEESPPPQ